MNIDTKAAASDIKRLLVKLREHDILLDPSTLPEALFLQVIEDNETKGIPELEEKPTLEPKYLGTQYEDIIVRIPNPMSEPMVVDADGKQTPIREFLKNRYTT